MFTFFILSFLTPFLSFRPAFPWLSDFVTYSIQTFNVHGLFVSHLQGRPTYEINNHRAVSPGRRRQHAAPHSTTRIVKEEKGGQLPDNKSALHGRLENARRAWPVSIFIC
ncbi:hypothetical protein LY78DRAFT_663190 [Colletotrichum sublineola]|nr:hypothetical protein LY78DRAFT_663190 [Colletotrichum sublineola]